MVSLPIHQLPLDVEKVEGPAKARGMDRRKRERAQVHWPLSFSLSGSAKPVQTITQDISSDGFYCIVNARLVPGETRYCSLTVPTHRPDLENGGLRVHCTVRIIRVEVTSERGFYGIGCQIIDYCLVNSNRDVRLGSLPGEVEPTELRMNIMD